MISLSQLLLTVIPIYSRVEIILPISIFVLACIIALITRKHRHHSKVTGRWSLVVAMLLAIASLSLPQNVWGWPYARMILITFALVVLVGVASSMFRGRGSRRKGEGG